MSDTIDDKQVKSLVAQAIPWALMNGIVMATPFDSESSTSSSASSANEDTIVPIVQHLPFTLLPTKIPKKAYDQVLDVVPAKAHMVHKISRDREFLSSVMETIIEVDEFMAKLYEIYNTVQDEGEAQSISFGLFRSDYMMHQPTKDDDIVLQQVEMNVISAAFAGMASKVCDMHHFLATREGVEGYEAEEGFIRADGDKNWPSAMAQAFKLYGDDEAVIMFVVQPKERNQFDQKLLEYELFEEHGIKVIRRTLFEIESRGVLDEETRKLTIDGFKVAFAYFRAGYTPRDYPSQEAWDARLKIERSDAIKSPSVAYQLVGTKKMQQTLANEGVVERYNDEETAAKIRATFAGLYSLSESSDQDQVEEIVAKAIANPELYVMKPYREGGGNNYFNEDIVEQLQKLSPKERSAFILMDRIIPPPVDMHFVRVGKVQKGEGVSEMGLYDSIICDGDEVILNKVQGYNLRSKLAKQDDGGVAAGVAVMDSPYFA